MDHTPEDRPGRDDRTQRFALLWVRSQGTVSAYVFGVVRSPHDAEDVLSEVAIAAVEHFDSYDPQRSFTGWVLGIARHRVLHYLRTTRRDRHVFSPDALESIAHACEEAHDTQDDRRAALHRCVDELGDDHQRLIEMRYGQSMKPAEIADSLGLARGAVRQKLLRIRQILADCIDRRLHGGATDA